MSKRPMPPVPTGDFQRQRFDTAVKQNLEDIMGQRGAPALEPLPATATLAEVIARINALQARLE